MATASEVLIDLKTRDPHDLVQMVTATEYAVSVTTGSDIQGANLNVHRSVPCEPTPEHPYRCRTEYAVNQLYPTSAEAWWAAFELGYIKVHIPRRVRLACGLPVKEY